MVLAAVARATARAPAWRAVALRPFRPPICSTAPVQTATRTAAAVGLHSALAQAARQPGNILDDVVQRLSPIEKEVQSAIGKRVAASLTHASSYSALCFYLQALARALYASTEPAAAEADPAAAAFQRADVNQDGFLSKHEFRQWFTNTVAANPPVATPAAAATPPTRRQLALVMLRNGVPFIGFGFLDNAGMIVFGEYIDQTLGVALSLSTMASAGLGNAVADVAGISFGRFIEAFAVRMGLPDPQVRAQAT